MTCSLFLWKLWNSSMAEIEAAKAYDDAVRDLHGEYAVLNLEKDYG